MKLRLPNEVRPPRRKKKASPFARIAGRFSGGHRMPAHVTGEDDWETEVPQIRMSRAFVVMLALHLVAVGGLFAFHLWGRESEEAAELATAPPPAGGEAPATETAVASTPVTTASTYTPPRVEVVPEPESLEPSAETPPLPEGSRSHVLIAGETRELVSARYNVSLADLEAANPDVAWKGGSRVIIPEPHRVIGPMSHDEDTASRPTAPIEPTPLPPQQGGNIALTPAVDPVPAPVPAPRAELASEEPVAGPVEAEGVPHAEAGKRTEVTYVQQKPAPAAPKAEVASVKTTPKPAPKAAPRPEPKKPAESTRAVSVKTTPKKAEPSEKEKAKPAAAPARAAGQRTHIVVKGDTIYNIAKRYGMPASEIQRLNNIKDDGRIRVGDGLKIPVRR